MNLARFSIARPVTIWMIALAVLLFGFVSLPKLAVELYPELNLPVAVVATTVEGGTPAEVEKLVTKPIEEALGTVSNVKTIMSNSTSGASQVIVQFNWGVDMDQATLSMRDKVDLVRGILPDSAKAPRILKLDPNSMPIMTLSFTGEGDVVKLKEAADNLIKPRLERIEGVASVGVSGGLDRVIEVVLDPDKLVQYNISIEQVQQALVATNVSNSAGFVREGDHKLGIRVQGEYQSVQEIRNTPVRVGTASIPLRSIATVEDTFADAAQVTYLDNRPSIGLSITKASGGNSIEVADGVKKELEALAAELPKGAKITTILDASQFIKDSIYTVGEHAIVGGVFSILILLVFLNSFRSMLIVAVVIPISVIATFCLMYFTNQTINLISLSGLTLGLGSLVDFAVVILENVFRHRQAGKGMVEAARLGSREVGTAVMASALAQIAVFLPIVFVDGLASELFGPLALTVIYSHIAALLASLALVPMLSSRWLVRIPDEEIYHTGRYRGFNPITWFHIGFNKLAKGYGKLLGSALKRRKTVFAVTTLCFIGAVLLVPMVGAEFIPTLDQGKITVSMQLPSGTNLAETEKVVREMESVIKQTPEVKQIYTSIGSSGGPAIVATSASNRAELQLTLAERENRTRSTAEVINELAAKLKKIAGAEIEVKQTDQSGGPQEAPLVISLRGDELDVLEDISSIILEEVKQTEGTRNVATSLQQKEQEYEILVDPEKASYYGLTTGQIISAVRTAFDGQTVTRYQTGEDEITVKLRLPRQYQENSNFLKSLRITSSGGAQVDLASVAEISLVDVPQIIKRVDQSREVQITSDIVGRDLNSVSNDIRAKLDKLALPDGYFIEYGGQSKDMMESFGSLGLAIILSIVLVYMVMASQFESLFSPFIIMFSVPPTFIGVVVGLFLTGNSFSVPVFIGYILLIGIVVNNAIVLIDYVNTLRKKGIDRDEAIQQAGPVRLRPILMTTLATILAIMPLAFGGGAGNESQAPMAIVVIFGLSFSTLITLILVPVVYAWFDDLGKKFRTKRIRVRKGGLEA